MLFVPGHKTRYIEAARRSCADAIIFDLEDSVPPGEAVDAARRSIAHAVIEGGWGPKHLYVRTSSLDAASFLADLRVAEHPDLSGIVLPKVSSGSEVRQLDVLLSGMERSTGHERDPLAIFPLIETAAGVAQALDIASASGRVTGLVFGGEDYLADTGGRHDKDGLGLLFPRSIVLGAARTVGILAIDTVFVRLGDSEGLASHLSSSQMLGFDGMLAVHPDQLVAINTAYTPSSLEIARSRDILEASKNSIASGNAVSQIDGEFVGPPMVKAAERVVSRSDGISHHLSTEPS